MVKASVFRLSLADLLHEWILTLCLVLAISAVIAPLLLLLGLKYGAITTLRDRLVQNPVYREIRPAATRLHVDEWFASIKGKAEVAFLIPAILPASSIVQVLTANQTTEILDLIPTADGDPLILEHGGKIPRQDQCVLTTSAAELLGVTTGDTIEVRISRSRRGHKEIASAKVKVISVLPHQAGSLERLYAPLPFVLDVESYKEGIGSPARGWEGENPRPWLSFDGIIALLPQALSPVELSGLAVNTGITIAEPLGHSGFRA